jgi:hypothetical protein
MQDKLFTVETQGGLGNQLFGLAFALYTAEREQRNFEISERQIDLGITRHGVRISDFDLNIAFTDSNYRQGVFERYVNSLNRRTRVVQDLKGRLGLGTYNSDVVGLDLNASTYRYSRYRGYFQSHIYAESLRQFLPNGILRMKNPSHWLISQIETALEVKPIMIHVRRGDYIKVQAEFGILSTEYYRDAIRRVREFQNNNPIWIFTDSPELVDRKFLTSIGGSGLLVVPISERPAHETMVLMQYGSANIISNSTFSWWPAFLNPGQHEVICPKEWFSGMKTPIGLIPDHWNQTESVWE